jgi:hypothetical protein
MRRIAPITTILLAVSAGCGDQAPPDYQGEPLATLHGVLLSELAEPLPEADIVMAWADWTKALTVDGLTSTAYWTFIRLPLEATLPARFTASVLAPPPETAYAPPRTELPRLLGPRTTSAYFLLARRGKDVTNGGHKALWLALLDPNEPILTDLDGWGLGYAESDGVLQYQMEDGTIIDGPAVTKGFHLFRIDSVECRLDDTDEACVADKISSGWDEESARRQCTTIMYTSTNVEVPLDTEMTFTVKSDGPDLPPRPLPPLCESPPA